jgi:hypothetical protein
MRCFEDLVKLRVFPDAKDISESYCALQAGIRQGMLQRAGTADAAESKKAARHSQVAGRKRGVLCISIGDGTTPREFLPKRQSSQPANGVQVNLSCVVF